MLAVTNRSATACRCSIFRSCFSNVGAASTQNISGINPGLRTPYSQQFNLTLERQVGQPPADSVLHGQRFYPLYYCAYRYEDPVDGRFDCLGFRVASSV